MKTETCRVDELKAGDRFRFDTEGVWETLSHLSRVGIDVHLHSECRIGDCWTNSRLVYVQRKPETLTVDKAKLEKAYKLVTQHSQAQTMHVLTDSAWLLDALGLLSEMLDGSHD